MSNVCSAVLVNEMTWTSSAIIKTYSDQKAKTVTIVIENEMGEITKETKFGIGDPCEYDWPHNLRCVGMIVGITKKTVKIMPPDGTPLRVLKFREFSWRNFDFELKSSPRENSVASMNF
jgi:hypothetical protein